MAKQVTILKVFISSPNDLGDEKAAVMKVISELNRTLPNSTGKYIQPIVWESDVTPGFGDSPQDVINEQIGDDYDVFVGIMWARFGTKTENAGSGSEEEFNRAFKRFRSDKNSLKLLYYFKTAGLPSIKDVDTEQLKLVNAFKESLGDKGGLYHEFVKTEEFEGYFRIHLTKVVQEYGVNWGLQQNEVKTDIPETKDIQEIDNENDDDYGFIDYVEIGMDGFRNLTSSSERITVATQSVGKQFSDRSIELKNAKLSDGSLNLHKAKKIINLMSNDQETFAKVIETETPIFSKSLNDAVKAFGKASSLYPDFDTEDIKPLVDGRSMLSGLEDTTITTIEPMREMRDAINKFPPMTSQSRKAKRRTLNAIDDLIGVMESSLGLFTEVIDVVDSVIAKYETKESGGEEPSE